MAKPAAKRVKVEKDADPEPAPTKAPVKEEKKPARPKTAAEVAHEREVDARTAPYKGRALFGRQLDINAVLGGNQRMEEDDMVDGIRLSSMPELEQQHWLDCWTWRGRGDLVEDFKNDPESVLVASDRLVFVSYDEQLYKDLKAHQNKRVAKMQRKK